jgi:CPA1 family monovalent cation:H+ antiporter
VVGTLVIQGVTLRPLVKWLAMDDGNPLAAELRKGRLAAYRAALDVLDGDTSGEAKILRLEYQQMLERSEDDGRKTTGELPADPLRRKVIDAARQSMLALRRSGEIGDDAFHVLEEEFDWAELSAAG